MLCRHSGPVAGASRIEGIAGEVVPLALMFDHPSAADRRSHGMDPQSGVRDAVAEIGHLAEAQVGCSWPVELEVTRPNRGHDFEDIWLEPKFDGTRQPN
jgi:hypothetical protein